MEQVTIHLTELAYDDLESIELYISEDSPLIARKFISHIFDKIEQLKKYPLSGKRPPEIQNQSVRELLLKRYRIIYQITSPHEIYILRVVHSSRLLDIEL